MFTAITAASAGILLREGLEAMLVLTALAAFLRKANQSQNIKVLWSGAGLAVLASIGMAWVMKQFFGGEHNDIVEGITMLAAAILMLYVSGWMFLRQDPQLWQSYLKEQINKATSSGSLLALGALAFLAVFREGAETALFINALAHTDANHAWPASLFVGLGIGAVGLVGLFYLLEEVAIKLPLRAMFLLTSAFLFFMGLNFIAEGFHEFQELGWISYNPLPWPASLQSSEIAEILTWESVLAIVGLAGSAVAATLWARQQRLVSAK